MMTTQMPFGFHSVQEVHCSASVYSACPAMQAPLKGGGALALLMMSDTRLNVKSMMVYV
jgi:hypothetical protein